jgi:hypothetical protein
MAVLVFAADDKAHILPFLQRTMPFKNEAFVLCFDKGKASRKTGEDGAHAASHDPLQSFNEGHFFLVEGRIFRNGKDHRWRVPLLQFTGDVVDKKFVAVKSYACIWRMMNFSSSLYPENKPSARLAHSSSKCATASRLPL